VILKDTRKRRGGRKKGEHTWEVEPLNHKWKKGKKGNKKGKKFFIY